MTTLDALLEIERKLKAGWCQRSLYIMTNEGPHYCLVGAVMYTNAAKVGSLEGILTMQLPKNIRYPFDQSPLTYFNDTSTKEEVLDLVRRAINAISSEANYD